MSARGPAVVTDSNAQLPPELVERFGVRVVPIPVVVDGREYLEGVDLDADGFYALFEGRSPEVSTSQPSPGAFAETYRECESAGHDEIISIHVAEELSGTLNSARLAADLVDATVHLVDSRTLSFGTGCCVWRAAELLAAGASSREAIAGAGRLADDIYSVTALGAAHLLEASGRVDFEATDSGVDVFLAGPGATFEVVGSGATADEVCDLMASTMGRDDAPINVALGIADASAEPYYAGLEQRLRANPNVVDIVRYRIGPSVGAFTGPGTAGGFWYPADLLRGQGA